MTIWQRRPVLVTGATGILGSWLTAALVARGAEVVALIRDEIPRSNFYRLGLERSVRVVRGDARDLPTVQRALGEYEVEAVFHLAAQTVVKIANASPLSTFESNIRGTWTVLEACRLQKTVGYVVVASSDKAYGAVPTLPYREDMPLRGRYPYDVSKSCADLIAQSYAQMYGLPVGITRCGNLYGGGDLNFNRIIPGTIRSIACGERPIIRSDGTYTRDYLYIADAVAADLFLAERLDDPAVRGEAFNIATGVSTCAVDLARRIAWLMERPDLEPVVQNQATGEIQDQSLSTEKAAHVLGWRRTWSLEDGLRETIDWYRRFLSADHLSAGGC